MLDTIRNILIVICISFASVGRCQEVATTSPKNFLTPLYSYYYLYDSTPVLQINHISERPSASSSFGMKYLRRIDEKNGWSTSLSFYNYVLRKPSELIEQGEILSRFFFLGEMSYSRNLLTTEKGLVNVTMGISTRVGEEIALVTLIPADQGGYSGSFVHARGLLDLGIPLSIEFTRMFGDYFHIQTSLSHTFFPLIYNKKEPLYEWDNGSPRNMTTLTFGLGVNF